MCSQPAITNPPHPFPQTWPVKVVFYQAIVCSLLVVWLLMLTVSLSPLYQVCEVYKLHRETYHLAQDYFDRFMATQTNVFKSTLQLIGITCLFIAAKVEVGQTPPSRHDGQFICCLLGTRYMSVSSPSGNVSSKDPPVCLCDRRGVCGG